MAGRLTEKDRRARKRQWYWDKSVGATLPVDRLGAASDYLKAAMASVPPDRAAEAATQAALNLFQVADQLMGVKP